MTKVISDTRNYPKFRFKSFSLANVHQKRIIIFLKRPTVDCVLRAAKRISVLVIEIMTKSKLMKSGLKSSSGLACDRNHMFSF